MRGNGKLIYMEWTKNTTKPENSVGKEYYLTVENTENGKRHVIGGCAFNINDEDDWTLWDDYYEEYISVENMSFKVISWMEIVDPDPDMT